MSENAEGSGKNRRKRELEKQQQAALEEAKATPATPPQDTENEAPAESPQAEPEQDTPKETEQPSEQQREPPKAEEPPKPLFNTQDVDWKSELERERKLRKDAEHQAKTRGGRLKELSKELQELKAENERLRNGGESDSLDRIRQTDEYKRIAEDFDENTAESFLGLAKHLAPPAPEPEPTPTDPMAISSFDEFVVALEGEVPGWDDKYNRNSEFQEWAENTIEPVSGKTYLALLNEAGNETFSLSTARNIFSAFDRQVSKNPSPEHYVEPRPSGGDGTAQPEAPTFKESDLKEAERKVRQGKMSATDFEKLRSDYMKAYNEGRVQLGQ